MVIKNNFFLLYELFISKFFTIFDIDLIVINHVNKTVLSFDVFNIYKPLMYNKNCYF